MPLSGSGLRVEQEMNDGSAVVMLEVDDVVDGALVVELDEEDVANADVVVTGDPGLTGLYGVPVKFGSPLVPDGAGLPFSP